MPYNPQLHHQRLSFYNDRTGTTTVVTLYKTTPVLMAKKTVEICLNISLPTYKNKKES